MNSLLLTIRDKEPTSERRDGVLVRDSGYLEFNVVDYKLLQHFNNGGNLSIVFNKNGTVCIVEAA